MIQRLRELQDLIGLITDIHVAAEELRDALIVASAGRAERLTFELIPWSVEEGFVGRTKAPPAGAQTGLVAMAQMLRQEGEAQFEKLEEWLDEPRTTLMGMLRKAGTVSRGGRI